MSHKSTTVEPTDAITWLQVHNLLPILTGVIGLITIFNLLQNKVELQNQRIDFVANQATGYLVRQNELEAKINSQALDIKELQTDNTKTFRAAVLPTKDTP